MIRPPVLMCLALLPFGLTSGFGQEARPLAAITGRVISSDGQPIARAFVDLIPVGGSIRSARRDRTNDEGKFSFPGLVAGAFSLLVEDNARMDFFTDEQNDDFSGPRICRPGDFVEVVAAIEKPGIITGRVTGPTGEPIVEAIVRAFRVRDSRGRRVQSRSFLSDTPWQRRTDDRGIYRIWWLEPGSYMISVGGEPDHGLTFRAPDPTDYDNDAPTYYSDSPHGEPTAVTVRPETEVNGIDIQYRGGSGHTVSGTLSGKPAPGANSIKIYLTNAATGAQQSEYLSRDRALSFGFAKVPDGDYDIAAVEDFPPRQSEVASKTVRVTVRGADVTGITLDPIAFVSITGHLSLDPAEGGYRKSDCQPGRAPLIEEVALVFTRDQQRVARPDYERPYMSSIDVAVDRKGDFAIPKLEPGTYHLRPDLPGDDWYVNSISAPGPNSKPASAPTHLSVKDGAHISGLTISLRAGAASLRGKVVATNPTNPGQSLRVHLVPLDPAEADNPLRFAETSVKTTAEFTLTHLPPGGYRLFALSAVNKSEMPLAETKEGRAVLRRRARREGIEVKLGTCQRLDSIVLRYAAGQ